MPSLRPTRPRSLGEILFGPAAPAPSQLRLDEAEELETTVELLHHFWQQLNRARIQCLCETLPAAQLEGLWRDSIRKVQALIERVALLMQDHAVDGLERVQHAVDEWQAQVQRVTGAPRGMADYCALQNRLEALARAIDLCVRMWQLRRQDPR